ncbi:MAG: peptidase, partial [bacterium]|nr:peptidase [bacterium]
MRTVRALAGVAVLLFAAAVQAQGGGGKESIDLKVVHRIKAEAFESGKVMDHLFWLTDANGPRLTNSPGFRTAAEWAVRSLKAWGASNPHLEKWGKFGRGWSLTRFSINLVKPIYAPLHGAPKAWSGGTQGKVTADLVFAPLFHKGEDQDRYSIPRMAAHIKRYIDENKGKLRGKIVLLTEEREFEAGKDPTVMRYDDPKLTSLVAAPESALPPKVEWPLQEMPADRKKRTAMFNALPTEVLWDFFARRERTIDALYDFFKSEGVAAVLSTDERGEGGVVFAENDADWQLKAPVSIPSVVLAPEHYNRLVRLVDRKVPTQVELDVDAHFNDDAPDGYNVIAEIPGRKKRDEVVMLGGHLDSWHTGTGATDNGAGSAVVLEAFRILKALNLPMDRTVRLALWSGEEQGLFGSRGYVQQHFGDPVTMALKPEHAKLSGYFNLDNGSGKIRGIYLQGNDMVRPIFESWLAPFKDEGATTITIRTTGGTDHQSFDAVGLPGFQFIQDEIEYDTRTHHSNQDVYDRIQADDMKQAAVIMAAFVYNTANRDEKLPRKPRPKPPVTATVQTTLATASEHIRQYAFDGNRGTFFASDRNPGSGDHFTLVFDEPVAVKSIAVDTGKAGGGDKLDAGALEVSADGKSFEPLARFAEGAVRSELKDRRVQAIRILPDTDMKHALAFLELAVVSEPPVSTFAFPVEFAVDVSDVPEMKGWAEKAAQACERSYPMINEALRSDGYKPPARIRLTLKNDYPGVAATSGDRITGSASFFKANPDDIGAMIHETTHVVQNYGRRE